MEGTETGWGRPAEPAPRWRALLDRALLGSRTGEQPQVDDGTAPPADDAGRPAPADGHRAPPVEGRRRSPETQLPPRRPVNPLDRRPPTAIERRPALPLDRRPVNPLDQRSAGPLAARPGPLDPGSGPLERRPTAPLEVRSALPLESRPTAAPEPRPATPLDERPVGSADQRPANPLDLRGPARLESRPAGALDRPVAPGRRPAAPPDQRPVNPLDRRGLRPGDGYRGRGEPASNGHATAPPHSFFNPPGRTAPTPVVYPPVEPAYPPAEPAYPVAEPAYPVAPTFVAAPTSAPASPGPLSGIEWRQSEADREIERATAVLRRSFGTPRVVAFANPKGGVHKTTATVLAAATVGSVRGRGVLAWDDNELRGTLGLRAGSARHARTIRHLISDLTMIESFHGPDLTDRLDDYLRHASDGSYDVLAGEENPRFAQRLDQHTVQRVMELLRRTHDVICVDTGNNVESVNWQTVLKAADQLVITTVPREDAAFTADWMLDLLHDIGMSTLADNAVTLLSCPTPGKSPLLDDLERHFATRTRAVAIVPYDPALETGSSIEYSLLQPETRQAWLRAAAVMMEPFAR